MAHEADTKFGIKKGAPADRPSAKAQNKPAQKADAEKKAD